MTTDQGAIFIADFAGKCISEKEMLPEPDQYHEYYSCENGEQMYMQDEKKYREHLAIRRSYPYPVKQEDDGKEIPESEFRLQHQYQFSVDGKWIDCLNSLYEGIVPERRRIIAIPIEPETKIKNMKSGIELIAAERQRQIDVEGWTPEHDAEHKTFEMSAAAACYIAKNISKTLEDIHHTNQSPLAEFKIYDFGETDLLVNNGDRGDRRLRKAGWGSGWPWDQKWWKPSDNPIKNLVKAGALIAAEIDRLQNQKP